MFGKKHTPYTINKITAAASKFNVELLNLKHESIKCFSSDVELAKCLNIHKTTVGRYIKSQKPLTINITLERL